MSDLHDDIPEIFVDIRMTRRIGTLPPMAMAAWQTLKGVVFFVALAGLLANALWDELVIPFNLRLAMSVIVVWLVWDQIIARRNYGTSHILATTKGLLFTDENVYVRWENIESYQSSGDLIRVRPAPGHGPRGLFAPKELDIPLSNTSRDILNDLFRDKGVNRWKPD